MALTTNNNIYRFVTRWLFSTNHKDHYILLNNVITGSFFSFTPPSSLGKINMFYWFLNQDIDLLLIQLYFISYVLMLLIAFFVFALKFILYKKDEFFIKKVIPHLKKLSPMRKVIFVSFTLFSAIPNKILINTEIHFIFVFIISGLTYILGFAFPIVFFCYLSFLVFCFESFVFGVLYEYSTSYKKLINFILFGDSDEPFAAQYFQWFWGNNMFARAVKKAGPAIGGFLTAELKRRQENRAKIRYADKTTEEANNTLEGFRNPTEMASYHTARRDEWVHENGTVTYIIKKIGDVLGS